MPHFIVNLPSGETVFGPEELPTPGSREQLCSLLASVLPGKRLEILQGERRLGLDDCVETAGGDSTVILSVVVRGGRRMPDGCSCESSQVIDGGILVQLVSDEYVFASDRKLPTERNGAPFIDPSSPSTATLQAGREFWAVQATRKTYNEVSDEDFTWGSQGIEDQEIHKEFWYLVDGGGNKVGWIMVARTSPRHLCFESSMPDAVFALTRRASRLRAREAYLQDSKWKATLEEKHPEEMSDMCMKDLQVLLANHGLKGNYMQRSDVLTDARAASCYQFPEFVDTQGDA